MGPVPFNRKSCPFSPKARLRALQDAMTVKPELRFAQDYRAEKDANDNIPGK
jgi:hypothetical protein